jgi:replicative DNA helicase
MTRGTEPRELPHRKEAEAAVLGGIMWHGAAALEDVRELIGEDDFYVPSYQATFRAMCLLEERGKSIDVIALHDQLLRTGELELVGGVEGLARLDRHATAHNIKAHAEIILEASRLRAIVKAGRDMAEAAMDPDADHTAIVGKAEKAVRNAAGLSKSAGPRSAKELMLEVFEGVRERQRSTEPVTGVATEFYEIDEMTAGLQPGDLVILAARPSMGKAQPLDAKVLTTRGFVAMGDVTVGEELASVDGERSVVTGVFPQGERQVYRITFSDGRSAECCDEHLWKIRYRGWDAPRVVTTAELRVLLTKARYASRLWVDPFSGHYGDRTDLPLDPWLLGNLIGNGSLNSGSVKLSTADELVLGRVRGLLEPLGMTLVYAGGYDYRMVRTGGHRRKGHSGVLPNPIKDALKNLGLWGHLAPTKFIPPRYFDAPLSQRRELLAGLIDSDGWVEKSGSVCYGTSSQQLAADVLRLVRSVGGAGSVAIKHPHYTYKGQKHAGLPSYTCVIQQPDPANWNLTSKRGERIRSSRTRQRRIGVSSIEPTRVTATQCISVSHPSRLYVTDDYIVTHNTALALNIAANACVMPQRFVNAPEGAKPKRVPVLVFSLEMGATQLIERLLCSEARVDYQLLRRGGRMSESEFRALIAAAERVADAPLWIDDQAALSITEMRGRARRWRENPKVFPDPEPNDDGKAPSQLGLVMVDYLQLARGGQKKYASRENEISEISQGLKAMAKDLKMPVVALAQLNRAVDARSDHRPQLSDLRESGAIEQDADVIMFIYREERYLPPTATEEQRAAVENKAEIGIAKQRNGPVGTVNLTFVKKHTRFENPAREYDGP